ncbi:MAG: hypothetical protein MO852_15525 [Candidatus Devosia euplotis]|nr:hypothetical protein [Candidatus Devosia euplotis]
MTAIELVTDLDQFEDIDVRYGGGGDIDIVPDDGHARDCVLTGIVRRDAAAVQYSTILTESSAGVVVWNGTVAEPAAEASQPGVLDYVSRRLSLVLGSPRGPLHVAARELLARTPVPDIDANLYLCRMLFHIYRETGTSATADRPRSAYQIYPRASRRRQQVWRSVPAC